MQRFKTARFFEAASVFSFSGYFSFGQRDFLVKRTFWSTFWSNDL